MRNSIESWECLRMLNAGKWVKNWEISQSVLKVWESVLKAEKVWEKLYVERVQKAVPNAIPI
jgi:hypothetical protein